MIKDYLERAVRSIELEEPDRAKEILNDTLKLMKGKEEELKKGAIPKKGIYFLYWDLTPHTWRIKDVEVVEVYVNGEKIWDKEKSEDKDNNKNTKEIGLEFNRIADCLVKNGEVSVITDMIPHNVKRGFVESWNKK